MKKKTKNDMMLGLFVLIGLLIFVSVIYFLGRQNQLIGSGIQVVSTFNNVSGLKSGNNVRLSGIKVGVVDRLEITSDTTVQVTITIENEAARFIKKDASAIIESEGLMGNKIVTISGGSASARSIEDGDEIRSRSPVGIDEAIQTIMTTAEESTLLFSELTGIIRSIREGEGLLGMVISDTTVKEQFKRLVVNVNRSSDEALAIAKSLKETTRALNKGEGLATRILYDTALANHTVNIIDTAAYVAGNLANASKELSKFSEKLNSRRGMIDKLLTDTLMAREVEMTIRNIREGSESIEGAVNTIENSWLLNLFSGNDDEKKKAESKQAQKKKKGTKELARENKP